MKQVMRRPTGPAAKRGQDEEGEVGGRETESGVQQLSQRGGLTSTQQCYRILRKTLMSYKPQLTGYTFPGLVL